MAMVGLGLVVARFRMDALGVPGEAGPESGWLRHMVGLGFTLLGIATLVLCTSRYFAVRRMLQRGEFLPMGPGVIVLSMGVLAVAGAVLVYLIALALR